MQAQSISSATAATARIIKSEAEAKAKQESEGETFFQRSRKRLLSGEAHAMYAEAVSNGNAAASIFMSAVQNPKHPDHAKNVAEFKNNYGMDAGRVHQAMIDRACESANADNPEDLKEDPAYEKQLEQSLRPKQPTKESLAFFDILKDKLKNSREVRGYGKDRSYDKKVVADWKSQYGQ